MVAALLVAGCTTKYYRKSADREVYSAIQNKSPAVPNMDPHFTIQPNTNTSVLEGLPLNTNVQSFLGPDGERERGGHMLSLKDALWIGVGNSRAYQSRKEQLYLSGLSLTLARHNFAPIFSASGDVNYGGETALAYRINPVTGELEQLYGQELVENQRIAASASLGASWLIRDVGKLTTQLTTDFIHFVTGVGVRNTSSSRLATTFTRPLLRNAGYKSEMEALTQAERQLVYDLRDFTQYRKDFAVQIARTYYNVLSTRETARNFFLNLESSRKNAERGRALAQEGRMTQADLGRLDTQVLTAEGSWVNQVRGYQQALDNFKFLLGLNVSANLVLDERELAELAIRDPNLSVDDSIQIALTARLDFLNAKDKLADANRKIGVAANFLLPQVDFNSSVNLNSNPDRNTGFQLPDPQRYNWEAGLFIDPGLDRLAERNSYRSALITREQAARAVIEQEDNIRVQVRDSWRTLDQAKRDYALNKLGVEIAQRRVEEQNLLAEVGRANALNQVDAQNALSDSKNQLTQALVTHTIARLQFWDNLGILYIKDNGQWEDTQDAKGQ